MKADYYKVYLEKLTKIVDYVKEHGEVQHCINKSDYKVDEHGYINFDKYIREINYLKLSEYDKVKIMADDLAEYFFKNNPKAKALPFNHPHFLEFPSIVTVTKNTAYKSFKINSESEKILTLNVIERTRKNKEFIADLQEHYSKYTVVNEFTEDGLIYFQVESKDLLFMLNEESSTLTCRLFTGHAYRLYCRGTGQERVRYGFMICCEKFTIQEQTARISPPKKLKKIEHDLLLLADLEVNNNK